MVDLSTTTMTTTKIRCWVVPHIVLKLTCNIFATLDAVGECTIVNLDRWIECVIFVQRVRNGCFTMLSEDGL
jgi:hypothetical protein